MSTGEHEALVDAKKMGYYYTAIALRVVSASDQASGIVLSASTTTHE